MTSVNIHLYKNALFCSTTIMYTFVTRVKKTLNISDVRYNSFYIFIILVTFTVSNRDFLVVTDYFAGNKILKTEY